MGFKNFLNFLFSFMLFRVVEDEGGGSSEEEDPDAIGDFTIEEEEKSDKTPETPDVIDPKEFTQMQETINAMNQEKAISTAVSDITSRHSDFDASKVSEFIANREKEFPHEKGQYNNAQAWELIHMREFATTKVVNDDVNHGRGDSNVKFDFGEALDAFDNGDNSQTRKLLENAVSTNY